MALAAAVVTLAPACDRGGRGSAGQEKRAAEPPAGKPTSPPGQGQPGAPTASTGGPDRRPSLVFLGDSLTAGFGLAADQAVPALIQDESDRAGYGLRVVNAGRSGDTTAGGAARIDYYLRPDVAPRAVVIWLGANDIMRGIQVAEIESNLRDIVKRVHAFDRAVPVFLVQMKAFPNLGADYAGAFEAIYPKIAESEGAILLPFPMAEVAGHPELNQPDGIHPTAEGTRQVADALWKALVPHLAPR